jgi:formate hydrogenlyase transcriptional activator
MTFDSDGVSYLDSQNPSEQSSSSSILPSDGVEELQRNSPHYQALFEHAPDAIVVSDVGGRIVKINAQAETMFGYAREELIGQKIEKLIPDRFNDAHEQHRATYSAEPQYRAMGSSQVLWGLRKNGSEIRVGISLDNVETQDGMLFCSIIRDISEWSGARFQQQAEFETQLSGLSAMFINVPPERVDEEVIRGLEILVRALDADRGHIATVFESETQDFIVSHSFAMPGHSEIPKGSLRDFLPWLTRRLIARETVIVEQIEDLPIEAQREKDYMKATGHNSALVVPFRVAGKLIGGLSCDSTRSRKWDAHTVSRMQDVADIFANALARKRADEQLQSAYTEIRRLKEELERENTYLRQEIKLEQSHNGIVGNSQAIVSVLKKAEQVAYTDSTVLILGETGTGKELIARTIHEMSGRSNRPMVKANCAALPATLIESELFGREKGAYTGALAREIGRFELADKSTIFLDEIGELPIEVQSKLLRVLQEGEFERLGSSKTVKVNVRVIAATSRDLQTMTDEGSFRKDLFYRLNVFPIVVPPLRERLADIPLLVGHILNEFAQRMGRRIDGVESKTMLAFQRYMWPGNVRELRNIIERNLILNGGPVFKANLSELMLRSEPNLRPLEEVEAEYLLQVLKGSQWRVRGKGGASEILKIKPTTLEARIKKLGLQRPH